MPTQLAEPSTAATPALPCPAAPGVGRWVVDRAASSAHFTAELPVGPAVTGRFTDVGGMLDLPAVGPRSIVVVVDASSLLVAPPRCRDRLTGPNLLDAANHRWMTLLFEQPAVDGDAWNAAGQLHVKGQPTAVTATFAFDPAHRAFRGALTVDRGAIGLAWAQMPGTSRVALGRHVWVALELQVTAWRR